MTSLAPGLDGDLRRLVDHPVRRSRIGVDDGKSGSPVERLWLTGGETVVVKHVRPHGDWLMRAMDDDGRAARLCHRGVLARVPPTVDHGVLGVVAIDDGWLLVMRDVGRWLFDPSHVLSRAESRRVIAAVHDLHEAFAGEDLEGLAPLHLRYTVLAPTLAQRERGRADAVPKLVERGWAIFADRVAPEVAEPVMALLDDPMELVAALARRPQTLVHGDLKVPNIGLSPGRAVLVDWGTMTGIAPAAVDWAWYVATAAGRIAASREQILDDIRAAEGGTHDPIAMAAALLGGLVQLGWNKALDAHEHPDPAVRAREREDLEWWVATARAVLDAWPLC